MRYGKYFGLAVPLGIGAVSLAFAATTPSLVSAQTPSLPSVTASQLLGDVLGAVPQRVTGTVQEISQILPSGVSLGGSSLSSLSQFLSGTNSFNVWRASSSQYRVQYQGGQSEQDLYVSGKSAWLWDSATQKATQVNLPSSPGTTGALGADPQMVADQFIQNLAPYGRVSLGANTFVGGIASYDLKIQSLQSGSTVSQVNIYVDSQYNQVLGVDAVASGSSSPSFSLEYSKVAFTAPSSSVFQFTPPPGATVKSLTPMNSGSAFMPSGHNAASGVSGSSKTAMTTLGAGFEKVFVSQPGAFAKLTSSGSAKSYSQLLTEAEQQVTVLGQTDQYLSTPFLNALVLPDGKILAGTVKLSVLEADATLLGNA